MIKLNYEDIEVGMFVYNEEGTKGIVSKIDGIHNIHVKFGNYGIALHCLKLGCFLYTPLFVKQNCSKNDTVQSINYEDIEFKLFSGL